MVVSASTNQVLLSEATPTSIAIQNQIEAVCQVREPLVKINDFNLIRNQNFLVTVQILEPLMQLKSTKNIAGSKKV